VRVGDAHDLYDQLRIVRSGRRHPYYVASGSGHPADVGLIELTAPFPRPPGCHRSTSLPPKPLGAGRLYAYGTPNISELRSLQVQILPRWMCGDSASWLCGSSGTAAKPGGRMSLAPPTGKAVRSSTGPGATRSAAETARSEAPVHFAGTQVDVAGVDGDGGPVQVVGDDPYDLDRDGDGCACESS
jgi:hypothetical protein